MTNLEDRIEAILAEWNKIYQEKGVVCASPAMDRIFAGEQAAKELESKDSDD